MLHDVHDLRIEEQAVGTPGPGEIAVAMAAGGICGSDLHYYHHGGFGAVRLRQPMILGHEVSGHVTALGEGVTTFKVGDLVALSPSRPCMNCAYCDAGKHAFCLDMRFFGSAMPMPHIQGAFRQHIIAEARHCVFAGDLTPGEAAMAEPLAVCLHAAGHAGDMLGKRVLVTGAGPIGALCVLLARAAGAAEVVATDLTDFTLGLAAKVGADRTHNLAETPDALDAYTANKGLFDVLFECTGVAAAIAGAVPAMRPGGTLVQVGLGGDMMMPMHAITTKELKVFGSFRFHPEFAIGVDLMRAGRIDVKPLITHTVPMKDAVKGFALASDRTQTIKAQIAFQ